MTDLSEQSQLSKAGALADTSQLILIIIVNGKAAFLHHIEHIPCASSLLTDLQTISQTYRAKVRAASAISKLPQGRLYPVSGAFTSGLNAL